ncbi:MAG: carboxypeptidase-like regulatory domain-containing protein, partial [Acidobacteriia bacterium]|nr:carboxypeptidase-like regulatory domain-containing protein [Terriglobia bacterium]
MPPDTYTVEIAQKGFKTFRRTGVAVSPGDRVGLGALTLEVGAVTETVTVTAEAQLLQTQSAERSFTVTRTEVENLPMASRTFSALASVLPGVGGTAQQPSRMGDQTSYSGGNSNIMMDGVSTMDSGNNALAISVNSEAIAEVKVLVSNYQAEYGRQSGLQVTAVTKGGTNQFHGTGFLIMRQSGWNANSKTNILNGVRKSYSSQKDIGFNVGGPIGKPGRNNKLFFFYSHEIDPRKLAVTSNGIQNYRFPTALERAGDFSQTTDNNGNKFTNIIDPTTGKPFSGSLIPASSQYGLGTKILNLFPMPNITTPGQYNYQGVLPAQNISSQEPIVKIDYQPWEKLRVSGKLTLWEQPATPQTGTLPGFNDSQVYKKWFYMWATTVTYNVGPTTFAEFTVGRTRNDLAGCFGPTNGVAPGLCTSAIPVNDVASMKGAGLTGLPRLYPDSGVLDKNYYAYQAMQSLKPPIWDGTKMDLVPQFSWGGRVANAPPNFPFPGWLNTNQNNDMVFSLTKLKGSHTIKGGLYYTHSYKAQQSLAGTWQGSVNFGNDTNNSLDSGFGFSNALLGVFSNYSQLSKYVEGNYVFNNIEAFLQDNWRATPRLTLDYGMRFVHQPPQHDKLGQGVNWLPDKWSLSTAPLYYRAACAVAQAPGQACPSASRRAVNPLTNQQVAAVAIGTLVPGSGNFTNGLFASGTDPVPSGTYYWPWLSPAPRFGFAYDLTGRQKIILRGGLGLTFDRPSGNTVFSLIANPPNEWSQTLYYSQFQTMGGLTTQGAANLNVYQLHSGLPSTWSWSGGLQYMLPYDTMLDVSYTGEHGYNNVEQVNINTVDMGSAYLAGNQDSTVASSLPGGAAVTQNMMRSIRGYGSLNMMIPRGWINSHFLQVGVNHRMSHGVQFLVNDTIALAHTQDSGARIQHAADGTWSYRSDQAQADALNDYVSTRHTFKGDFVYSIPALSTVGSGFSHTVLKAVTRD